MTKLIKSTKLESGHIVYASRHHLSISRLLNNISRYVDGEDTEHKIIHTDEYLREFIECTMLDTRTKKLKSNKGIKKKLNKAINDLQELDKSLNSSNKSNSTLPSYSENNISIKKLISILLEIKSEFSAQSFF